MARLIGVLALCVAAGTAFAPAAPAAEEFPARLIKLIVPFPAGSATDTEARFLADQVGKTLGQTLIVENRAGANGNLAASEVARSEPDGYKLLLATNSSHSANQHLYRNLPFDPVKDFAPVARLTRNPLVLVVRADSPVRTVADLIAMAKASPGRLSYGTGNTGNTGSLAAVQIVRSTTGIEVVKVPYQGTPASITDLLGGRIDFVITDVAVVRGFVEEGRLRALGVTTAARLKTMPGVPTLAEAGLPDYAFAAWSGLFAPAGTPTAVVDRLSRAFLDALAGPEADRFFDKVGLEPDPGGPEALAAHVAAQTEVWRRVVADSGLEKM